MMAGFRVEICLDYQPQGYAHIFGRWITIFLTSIAEDFMDPWSYDPVPFNELDGILAHFVLHEILYAVMGASVPEEQINSWYKLGQCLNSRISDARKLVPISGSDRWPRWSGDG